MTKNRNIQILIQVKFKHKIMAKNDTNKSDGPSCACGKEDFYEVWLKNEKLKKENKDNPQSILRTKRK